MTPTTLNRTRRVVGTALAAATLAAAARKKDRLSRWAVALSERRGPATVARELYHEDADSIARREARQLQLKAEHATFPHGEGRPTKKTRRQLSQFKDGLG